MTRSSIFPYHRTLLLALAIITLVRLTALYHSPLNLHGDEAQYWAWSRSFEFGYFSKPPMIAWLIAATTALFGNAEWAVRLSSCLIHPITAYILYKTGKTLHSQKAGFYAALFYFFMPAVWLSSGIVSTDVGLLLFWALALYCLTELRAAAAYTPPKPIKMSWVILLGLAIGFGFLSKYAMLFFIISMAIFALTDRPLRRVILSRYGAISGLIAAIIISPNLIWNLQNDLATLSHTAANANLGHSLFHPIELFEFVISQLGVFGPLSYPLIAIAAWVVWYEKDKRFLLVFFFVPFLIICLEAFLSRANANWAVSAYIAASLLIGYAVAQGQSLLRPLVARFAIGVNLILGVMVISLGLLPNLANQVGAANVLKRVRAWPQTVQAIDTMARDGHDGTPFTSIATDNRLVFFDLKYYQIQQKSHLPLRMWKANAHPAHHAELTAPLLATQGPVLLINYFTGCHFDSQAQKPDCLAYWQERGGLTTRQKFEQDFERLEPLPDILIPLGGGKVRKLRAFAAYGYTPTTSLDR